MAHMFGSHGPLDFNTSLVVSFQDLNLSLNTDSLTWLQQHLRGDVVGGTHQRVGLTSLVFHLPSLQRLEHIFGVAMTVITPWIVWLHGVLPTMVTCCERSKVVCMTLLVLGWCIAETMHHIRQFQWYLFTTMNGLCMSTTFNFCLLLLRMKCQAIVDSFYMLNS